MCEVGEDHRELLAPAPMPSVSKQCVKCNEALAAVVIRVKDAYCKGCFKEYFIHKFRAMLGKNRIIFPGEKVLLAVSGGPSSSSMLSQVQEGLSQNAHKKLRFVPGIVYIDEGGVLGQSTEERQRLVTELQAVFRLTGFSFHIVPLEQVLGLPSSVVMAGPSPSERPASDYKAAIDQFIQSNGSSWSTPEERKEPSLAGVQESHTRSLQQLMGCAKTLTAKEDLLSILKQHLLVHTARTQGYSKIMLGDNCTRLAVKLLTSISLGRGAQLAHDTGFSDSRYNDIVLVRPMRDYTAREIAYYNHIFRVPSVFIPSLDTKTNDKSSIQRLTESFVTKLQADFPSTVSTIYRTSEKLQTTSKSSSTADICDRCLLCMCPLDTVVGNASAFQATLLSERLSQTESSKPACTEIPKRNQATVEAELPAPGGQCCSSGRDWDSGRAASGRCCSSSTKEQGRADLKKLLCYSCQLTVKDISSVERLPQYVLSEAQRRQRRSQMKEEINEFLLADEDD